MARGRAALLRARAEATTTSKVPGEFSSLPPPPPVRSLERLEQRRAEEEEQEEDPLYSKVLPKAERSKTELKGWQGPMVFEKCAL